MCHLVLVALPILSLVAFWLLPGPLGIASGIALAAGAALFYRYLFRAARRPVTTGVEALAHALGRVRNAQGGTAWILLNGELWSARSAEDLQEGDEVEVVGIEGLRLHVRRIAGAPVNEDARPR